MWPRAGGGAVAEQSRDDPPLTPDKLPFDQV
jgi:hypothetical protein